MAATADAIDKAVTMTPGDPVATLNASGLDAAIEAFEKYFEVQERGTGIFQAALESALWRTRPEGEA